MVDLTMVSDLEKNAETETQTFRIAWRSSTGAYGRGACMPRHIAEALLNRANAESPGLTHWLEPCGDAPLQPREPSAFSKSK